MATTYTLISSVTVGSGGASSIGFTSIPQTYTDLVVLISSRNNSSNYGGFYMKFNGSSLGSNVTAKKLQGDGSSAGSNSQTDINWTRVDFTSNTFANSQIYIPNYTGSNNKSASFENAPENNATFGGILAMSAWLWSQTTAVTQIDFGTFDGSFPNDYFVQYSTAYLYGISNA
jgi:hypothetical protein